MKNTVKKLTLSAMFIAIGLVLPLITGGIPQIGNMLLPMHLPVFLCGLICGWKYGLAVGFILPLLRSAAFSMPPMYPVAIAMAFELAAYGFVAGILYEHSRAQNLGAIYRAIGAAMLAGRIVWGLAMLILLGVNGGSFTWPAFLSGAVLTAIPGIIAQLVLIPAILVLLDRSKLVPFRKGV